MGLIVHKGIHCGNCLEQWIGSLLQAKGRTRFRDISEKRQSRLKIIAADVTQKEILILPDGLARYGIDPMDFEISRAVRMSASIPFYFNPVPLSYRRGKSLIVDGGILSNFPIWLFDVKGIPRWPTIGFRLVGGKPGQKEQCRKGVLSYTLDIAETIIDRNDEMYLNDKDAVRTISIPAFGIKATRFDLSREESRKLYESGYNKAKSLSAPGTLKATSAGTEEGDQRAVPDGTARWYTSYFSVTTYLTCISVNLEYPDGILQFPGILLQNHRSLAQPLNRIYLVLRRGVYFLC